MVGRRGVRCGLHGLAGCRKLWYQDGDVITARSRWRWTIVVMCQFSFVATSVNHPPAGSRCGVERAAFRIRSHTGRTMWQVVFSVIGLLCVVMACSPGPFQSQQPRWADRCARTVRSPRSGSRAVGKEDPPGKAVRGYLPKAPGLFTRGRVYGCPAYCRGTHTLIRKSAYAAHIIVKYTGCSARTVRFNDRTGRRGRILIQT